MIIAARGTRGGMTDGSPKYPNQPQTGQGGDGPLPIRAVSGMISGRPPAATIEDDRWIARQWALTMEGRQPEPVRHVPPKRIPGWVFFLVLLAGVNIGPLVAYPFASIFGFDAALVISIAVILAPLLALIAIDSKRR